VSYSEDYVVVQGGDPSECDDFCACSRCSPEMDFSGQASKHLADPFFSEANSVSTKVQKFTGLSLG
jgi:hypothetical protein